MLTKKSKSKGKNQDTGKVTGKGKGVLTELPIPFRAAVDKFVFVAQGGSIV